MTPRGAEPEWTRDAAVGRDGRSRAARAHLPAEIDRVYLQADLTAIAPGPLAPALDLRLRGIATRESRAQASTYRFTRRLARCGHDRGRDRATRSASSSRGLSLTGIPQPLEYLIESTAARHGLVRVRADDATGRTRRRERRPGLLDTIAVDQALRPLGLVRDGRRSDLARRARRRLLVARRRPLSGRRARAGRRSEPLHRRTRRGRRRRPGARARRYARLIAPLRGGHETDAEAAWLGRELEQAVRARVRDRGRRCGCPTAPSAP